MLTDSKKELLSLFVPVSLNEIDSAKLMDRVDIKYILHSSKIQDIMLKMDGAYRVLEINETRQFPYLTTYYDTNDYSFFNQHVTGRPERSKVRFRNYLSTGTTFLEIKKRTINRRTIKWRIEKGLPSDNMLDENSSDFIRKYVPHEPGILSPVIKNTFTRITLVSKEMDERITIDYDLSFSDPHGNRADFPFIGIIELKKEGFSRTSRMTQIMRSDSLHPTSFSKYCIGTSLFYDLPKRNLLKPNMLQINKIRNEFKN
jgi:hypothetical protein